MPKRRSKKDKKSCICPHLPPPPPVPPPPPSAWIESVSDDNNSSSSGSSSSSTPTLGKEEKHAVTSFVSAMDEYIRRNLKRRVGQLAAAGLTQHFGQLFLGLKEVLEKCQEEYHGDEDAEKAMIGSRARTEILLTAVRRDLLDTMNDWILGCNESDRLLIRLQDFRDELCVKLLRFLMSTQGMVVNVANLITDHKPAKDQNRAAELIEKWAVIKDFCDDYFVKIRECSEAARDLDRDSVRLRVIVTEVETTWTKKLKKYYEDENTLLIAKEDHEIITEKKKGLYSNLKRMEEHKKFCSFAKKLAYSMTQICHQMRSPIPDTVAAAENMASSAIKHLYKTEFLTNSRLAQKGDQIDELIKRDRSEAASLELLEKKRRQLKLKKKKLSQPPKPLIFPCDPSLMTPSPFIEFNFDGIVASQSFEYSTESIRIRKRADYEFNLFLGTTVSSFGTETETGPMFRVEYLGHWIFMLKFNDSESISLISTMIPNPDDHLGRLYIKCQDEEIWNGLMNDLKNWNTNLSTLRHLCIELGNTAQSLEDLLGLKLKLTVLKLTVLDKIDPYLLLNFLLQQSESLEILILRLPKSFNSTMATALHSVYPFSKVLKQYTLYRNKTLVFQCSEVRTCNLENHGKTWPGTKKAVNLFANMNKNIP